ncbi:jg2891 [Pararge aegeria aegeria]|uniref:Jg2891 protein n=1 Tax=Pararge aegeria aegeria TaxID=348720 RepID=A0A8S4SLM4_9NEOP|nr:jg2891 [Pararge aegeria aegeria]
MSVSVTGEENTLRKHACLSLAQSLHPVVAKPQEFEHSQVKQTQYVSSDLMKTKPPVSMEMTPSKLPQDSIPSTPSGNNVSVSGSSGALDEFYAGTLDSSFLEDLGPITNTNQEINYETDSDEETTLNPKVIVDEDDLEVDNGPPFRPAEVVGAEVATDPIKDETLSNMFSMQATISKDREDNNDSFSILSRDQNVHMHSDYPIWAGDSSVRRSPEGGEDPDNAKELDTKVEKKHKKKKSKDKDKGDYSDKSDRTEKKSKHKKSKSEKRPNPQKDLLEPSVVTEFNYEEYDSI